MEKYIVLISILLSVLSCTDGQKQKSTVINNNNLEEYFKLEKYKNQKKIIVNDSIQLVKANDGSLFLEGNFNTKQNEKSGIWTLTNNFDKNKVEVDYIVFGKKDVHRNQIIFYKDGVVDSLQSKFYKSYLGNKDGKKRLFLTFFSPHDVNDKFAGATIKYIIGRNHTIIREDSVVFKKGNGIYRSEIDFNFEKGHEVGGYFSEFVSKKMDGDSLALGNNTIYFNKVF